MSSTAPLSCKVIATDSWSSARALDLHTAHGVINTPIFMPVATQAALRCVDLPVADQLDYQVLLANTYHLLLRPGPEILAQHGGLHRFMNWPRSVLTDSGGFQIFSLARQLAISEHGATFRSYVDGARIELTPERSIEMQRVIGSDIMMVLDHCISSTSSEAEARAALELTTRWAKRSFAARGESYQALFGIVQGACFNHLRRESAEQITQIPFDGFALGGLAVGESKSEREDTTEFAAPLLPANKPRYLMGVGTPIDLLEAVRRGIDMFDCILPTSLANQGVAFTSRGRIDLRRGVYRSEQGPLDPRCACSTCSRYTRSYLQHLVRSGEFIVGQLLSIHNLNFYRELMRGMRASIIAGDFKGYYHSRVEELSSDDLDNPPKPPPIRAKSDPMALGDYQVLIRDGAIGAIRHRLSDEVMHVSADPCTEARSLYVDGSGLLGRLSGDSSPLVIWDVGLGAATNSMVALKALEELATIDRPVEIISFENDLDPLKLALRHPGLFAHLRHAAPHHLLRDGAWRCDKLPITWRLSHGDFLNECLKAKPPNIIWFDPFSSKVNAAMWELAVARLVFERCEGGACTLHTYSSSTLFRASLLYAGWYVGVGSGTGMKRESTRAFTPAALNAGLASDLLDSTWLARWERSHAQVAAGVDVEEFKAAVREHAQWRR